MKTRPQVILETDQVTIATLKTQNIIKIPEQIYRLEIAVSQVGDQQLYLGYRLAPKTRTPLMLGMSRGELEIDFPSPSVDPIVKQLELNLKYRPEKTAVRWVSSLPVPVGSMRFELGDLDMQLLSLVSDDTIVN